MKARDKAWELYSNYFDIVARAVPESTMVQQHHAAINAATYAVNEALANASDEIMKDFESTGEFYSVKAYYHHVQAEVQKLNRQPDNEPLLSDRDS